MRPAGHDSSEVQCPSLALFAPSLGGGGAERVILDLAAGFKRRGIQVDLVLVRVGTEDLALVLEGVRLIDLDSNRTATSILKLVRYLRRERPDVLLSTLAHANAVALLAKFFLLGRLRAVVRMENTFSEMYDKGTFKQRLTLRILKLLLPAADGIVAVSQGVADDLHGLIPDISHKVATIYNPVVRPEISDQAAAPVSHSWFGDECAPVILSAGRLTTVKDHATLLRAFVEVLRSRPARLVILGVGPERENLLELAKSLDVSQYVDLPGFEINPFAYMYRSKVFVLSSRYEGFPNVLA